MLLSEGKKASKSPSNGQTAVFPKKCKTGVLKRAVLATRVANVKTYVSTLFISYRAGSTDSPRVRPFSQVGLEQGTGEIWDASPPTFQAPYKNSPWWLIKLRRPHGAPPSY